jgi:hypothetical protein
MSKNTYLIDMRGRVVKAWKCDTPAMSAYLLESGNLLRVGSIDVFSGKSKSWGGPGASGGVQMLTWEGELVWDYRLNNDRQLSHHDAIALPNGNVLMVVWEKKSGKEAIAAGRDPNRVGDYFMPDSLLEVKPTGKTTGKVVWEWHLWDHLVQDHDKTKANFGNVAEHPELVDVNYGEDVVARVAKSKDGDKKLKSLGYVGSPTARKQRVNPDWTHFNAVAYNPALDQIAVTVHNFSEVWIIDHGTTTAEAVGHKGGRSGRGGDLLYRWGNPRTYRAGTKKDQKLFGPHNTHWVASGLPGVGHLMVFNNGMRRPDGNYSTVDEIVAPVDSKGRYVGKPGTAYGPDGPLWSYAAAKKSDFFSMLISGSQRLPNGDTLICSGVNGVVFEVTPKNETVWKYTNPAKGGGPGGRGPGGPPPGGPPPGGFGPPGGFRPPQGVQLIPGFFQDMLEMSDEQRAQVEKFQKGATARLDKILTEEQRKQLRNPRGGFGGLPQPGQILSPFQQARLKLSAGQKKQVAGLQKEADAVITKTLNGDQRKRFDEMRKGFGRGPGFGPGFGRPGGQSLFRAYRYGPKYPGLAGKDLEAGKTIEELEKEAQPKKGKQAE